MSKILVDVVKRIRELTSPVRRQAAADTVATHGDGWNAGHEDCVIANSVQGPNEGWVVILNMAVAEGGSTDMYTRFSDRVEIHNMLGMEFVLVDRATGWTKYQRYLITSYYGAIKVPSSRVGSTYTNAYRYGHIACTCQERYGADFSHGDLAIVKYPVMQNKRAGTSYTMATPDTFTVTAQADGHLLSIGSEDVSLLADGFMEWDIEQADDALGTNAQTFVYGAADLPTVLTVAAGTTKYYRIRSVSAAGDLSAWTSYSSTVYNAVPAQPQWVSHAFVEQGHLVTWYHALPAGVDYFNLYRNSSASDTGATLVAAINRNDTSYIVPYDNSGDYFGLRAVGFAGTHGGTVWGANNSTEWRVFKDKFDGYGGDSTSPLESLYWLQLAEFTAAEGWNTPVSGGGSGFGVVTTPRVQGDSAFDTGDISIGILYPPLVPYSLDLSSDGRFTNSDYVEISAYLSSGQPATSLVLIFATTISGDLPNDHYATSVSLSTGWNHIKIKKSDFTTVNSPSWANINYITVQPPSHSPSDGEGYFVDDLRIVKADPDDSTTTNDTGAVWDIGTNYPGGSTDYGVWHIYAGNRAGEPGKPYSYGQIKTAAAPGLWYISTVAGANIDSGTVQCGIYLKDADGGAGLAFFVTDTTPLSWDMYAVEVWSSSNLIKLVKWVNGTWTQLATATVTITYDEILWLAADFREFNTDGGRLRVYASSTEGNIVQAANLIISTQDTSISSGGTVGVMSRQANVRFVDFTAGSPAHAETADVAKSLDGPIIYGESSRLWLKNGSGNVLQSSANGADFASIFTPSGYTYSRRTFSTTDTANADTLGFEDSQTTPYAPGGSFAITNPGSSYICESASYPHWLYMYNYHASSPLYLEWTSATAKNYLSMRWAVSPNAAVTGDGMIFEIRFWAVQTPGASDKYWALRFVQYGTSKPQYPNWAELVYGTGVTFPGTPTAYNSAPFVPGAVMACTITVNNPGTPSFQAEPFMAEGFKLFGGNGSLAGYPGSFKTARIYIPGARYVQAWIDDVVIS